MSDETRGVRSLPPALLFGFALWFTTHIAWTIFLITAKEPWTAFRFNLAMDGIGYAAEILSLIGVLAMCRQASGQSRLGLQIGVASMIGALLVDLTNAGSQFLERPYEHDWIYKFLNYGYFGVWMLLAVGIAVAIWRDKRALAIVVLVVGFLIYPPHALQKILYGWLPSGNAGYAIDAVLRMVRFGVLLAGLAQIRRSPAVADRMAAASGLRTAAKALWLRVIAAVGVVLLTLMVIGGKGSEGSLGVLKLAMFSALIINIIALVQFGIGAARASGADVPELGRWPLVIGGAASLWGAGVMVGQSAWLYRMLYKGDSSSMFGSGGDAAKYAQALSVAMPLIITGGIALIAVAVAGLASRRANADLSATAQAKGAGFVTLTLVSIAIQTWMLPKATSLGSFAMLSLLSAGAGLAAIVMMAKLLHSGAEELEREPGLPTATVVGPNGP